MSLKVLRGQLQMCGEMLAATQAMLKTTVQSLDEVIAENNGKPKETAAEPEVRKAFGSAARTREAANGAAA